VAPRDTGHQATANLTIKPDSSVSPAKVFNASARVMPAAAAAIANAPVPEKMTTQALPSATPATAPH
jgi:hypothetical protein